MLVSHTEGCLCTPIVAVWCTAHIQEPKAERSGGSDPSVSLGVRVTDGLAYSSWFPNLCNPLLGSVPQHCHGFEVLTRSHQVCPLLLSCTFKVQPIIPSILQSKSMDFGIHGRDSELHGQYSPQCLLCYTGVFCLSNSQRGT
jgi:hypothetical protein